MGVCQNLQVYRTRFLFGEEAGLGYPAAGRLGPCRCTAWTQRWACTCLLTSHVCALLFGEGLGEVSGEVACIFFSV